ncbi:MAG: TIGR04282 family arsenosugar biosynthesis glycosyltransferase [Acidobacteriia bacterium]|nr:TIGR04282 family arsenosugar biosynthesis glycosyltransferase [Terriglobia bacterium]
MARAPSSPGKTRLASDIPEPRLRGLREALLRDTLAVAAAAADADPFVFFTPADGGPEIAALVDRALPMVAQVDGDLGQRMAAALDHLLQSGEYVGAMLVGSDVPLLSAEHVSEASELLRKHDGVVLGPSDDGGYYLIGMTTLHRGLFEGIRWGSDEVLDETLRAADRLGVELRMIRGDYDVDTINDLRRLERDLAQLPPEVAPRVRAWFEGSPLG